MNAEPELLLDGPRGRRLCLELAAELSPDVRNAAFSLAYELDPGKGTSTVMFALSSDDSGDPGFPGGAPSLEDLAAELQSIDASSLTSGQLAAARECSVRNARYWQEPAGEDVLASLPAVVDAFRPLAEQVLASPTWRSWSQPRRPEQWAIDWRSAEDPAPLPRDPHQALSRWAKEIRAEEAQAARDRPQNVYANFSGNWWSFPGRLLRTVGAIPAALNLVEDSFGEKQATVIPVYGSGRTFEIQTAEDWILLCRSFPLEVTASRRHDWFHTTGRDGRWVIPDWQLLAGEWDAVHLTTAGYLHTAGRALQVGADTASVLAGLDPDSTLWLGDVAREAEAPRQLWRQNPNSDDWSLVHSPGR
ncbi:hypothetical protein H9639_00835 [Arthrobacter sp. Sa2CUA1]|uniref:DUF4262 domain-containing protein n=1 Tax=Arthrobacter gallicola TaxID=2762225 RepID=A0ABR8UMS7_9MICC|nr:hypothetical protein [Arthrobacter gallicola]MBD7993850.1 hypothetical protein [Arthrobacter gallicola]